MKTTMKIPRYARQTAGWPWDVSGKTFPSYGAACAFALDHASRTRSTLDIREHGDIVARAVGDEHGHSRLVIEGGAA